MESLSHELLVEVVSWVPCGKRKLGLFFVNDRFAEVIHDPAAHVHRPELDEEAEVLDVTGLPLHLLARLSFLKARRLVRPLEYCNRLEVLHLAPLPTYVGLGAALRGFQGLKEIRLDATHLQENTLALPAVTEQFRHLKHLEEITIVGLMGFDDIAEDDGWWRFPDGCRLSLCVTGTFCELNDHIPIELENYLVALHLTHESCDNCSNLSFQELDRLHLLSALTVVDRHSTSERALHVTRLADLPRSLRKVEFQGTMILPSVALEGVRGVSVESRDEHEYTMTVDLVR